jgi:hypothetical protein
VFGVALAGRDPDLTADELQAALERPLGKRDAMRDTQCGTTSAKLLRMLPNAARLYREQIAAGLDGDRDEAEKARELLRNTLLVGGEVKLVPQGRGLYAHFTLRPAALLVATGTNVRNQSLRTVGSGGRI